MQNLSKIPTPKPPPQREGALGSFPTSQIIRHTEGEARSISKDSANNAKSNRDISLSLNMTTKNEQAKSIICHLKRSEVSKEVSKNPSANLQKPLDISVSTKPQYDNVNVAQYDNVIR